MYHYNDTYSVYKYKYIYYFIQQDNEQSKIALEKQQEISKQKYMMMKGDLEKKLQGRETLIEAMKEKLVVYQKEADTMKSELNSQHVKDNAIKKQIMSMFEDKF